MTDRSEQDTVEMQVVMSEHGELLGWVELRHGCSGLPIYVAVTVDGKREVVGQYGDALEILGWIGGVR